MGRKFIFTISLLLLFIHSKAQTSNNQDSLLNVVRTIPDSPEKVSALFNIGFNYSRVSTEKALTYYWKAISLGEKINDEKNTTVSYTQISILYNNLGNTDSTDFYMNKAYSGASKLNDNKVWGSYYQTAVLVYKKRKDYKKAINAGKKGIEYNLKTGKKENIAGAYLNLGNTYFEDNQLKNSITQYQHALRYFEEIKNQRGMAYTYNSLGIVYQKLGQHREALKNISLSLEIKKAINDNKGVASSYQSMSVAYISLKEYEKAIEYSDKSNKIYKELKIPDFIMMNYQNKAVAYSEMKDTLKAIENYTLALEIANDLNDKESVSDIKRKLSLLNKPEKNDGDIAISILEKAKEEKDSAEVLNQLNFLSDYYYTNKNFKKAFDYQKEYNQIKELVYGPELVKQLKELESVVELQKKENSIQLLEKDKQIGEKRIQLQKIGLYSAGGIIILIFTIGLLLINRNKIVQEQKRLIELEKMRKNISRDLHDDIGSTLSSIQIMSNLAEQQSTDNPKLNEAIVYIKELSAKVADGVREIVWSVNPEHDKLNSIVEHMRKMATEMLNVKNIKLNFKENLKKPGIEISPNVRKELFMIFKESLNNSIKYSDTKNIDIYIGQSPRNIFLEIKDYGKGFEISEINRGNGLNNIEKRAETLNGEVKMISVINKGTEIKLKFPIP